TMKLTRLSGPALLLAGLCLCLGGPAEAQKKKGKPAEKEVEKKAEKHAELIDLGTAFQLVEYGEEDKAPEASLSATWLIRGVASAKVKALKGKMELLDSEGKAVKADLKCEPKVNLKEEADALLIAAQKMAGKLKLTALSNAVKKRKARRTLVG